MESCAHDVAPVSFALQPLCLIAIFGLRHLGQFAQLLSPIPASHDTHLLGKATTGGAEMERCDALVIGSGPAGLSCG